MTQTELTSTASLTGKWKPYPAYKDSGVEWLGEIPKHWEAGRLKFIARLSYGDSLPADDRKAGDIPVFGSNGPVGFHSEPNTLAPVLVIGRKGSFGKVNFSDQPCFAIDTTYYIDARNSNADLRWLFYAMLLLRLDTISEDSAIPGLSRELAEKQWLPLISLSEQKSIANFLDRETAKVNALIAKKERLIELLQEKRAALISNAVTKGLEPTVPMKDSGVEWLGEIPEHWEVRRLKHITKDMIAGPFGSSLTKDMYTKQGYRVYGQEQVIPADFTIGDYYIPKDLFLTMGRYAVEEGDVLVSCVGTFGKVAVVPPEAEPGIINPRLVKLVPNRVIILPNYLCLLLRSQVAFEQMEQVSRGGTMGVINLGLLSEVLLPIPSLTIQHTILTYIDRETSKIDTLISKIHEGIEKLKEYSTALVSAAVTGKIDVRDEILDN